MLQKEIRRLREMKGWSQEELAKKLHITQHTLSQYETGKRHVSIEMFETILNELGAKLKYVVEDSKMIMKEMTSKFFAHWNSLEERFPEWDVTHTGGGIWVLSKNVKTKLGTEIGVWVADTGAILRNRMIEDNNQKFEFRTIQDEYVTVEEAKERDEWYFECEDLCYLELFTVHGEGWKLSPEANLLFHQEELDELTYIAGVL